MKMPANPKIYHIVHVDRLPSIIEQGYLFSDVEAEKRGIGGPDIGMQHIKQYRRMNNLRSRPGLRVGNCVPFYFCSRSVMLYVINRANQYQLAYRPGQEPIIHLEADLRRTVNRANESGVRWAFTTSNAGSGYFEDFSDLRYLHKIEWDAVRARLWTECSEKKQAEFLVENTFPWELVSRIGVQSSATYAKVLDALQKSDHRPLAKIMPSRYYYAQYTTYFR